jgi:hypothetical protein
VLRRVLPGELEARGIQAAASVCELYLAFELG